MSPLKHFMNVASAILNAKDDAVPTPSTDAPASKMQPPVFIRTTWLFAEVDEAIQAATILSHQIKVARLNGDAVHVKRLVEQLRRTARQIEQMAGWANEQFQREAPNAD